jgi:hypothetical protein
MIMGLVVGGGLVATGIATLWAERNPLFAETLIRFWPLGLIAVGLALLLRNEARQ